MLQPYVYETNRPDAISIFPKTILKNITFLEEHLTWDWQKVDNEDKQAYVLNKYDRC